MKTFYLNGSNSILIDSETGVEDSFIERESVSGVWAIEDDCKVQYTYNGEKIELDAKKGQVLVRFYTKTFKNNLVLVDSPAWYENLIAYKEAETKRLEEWAAKQTSKCENCDCDCENTTCNLSTM